MPEFVLIFIRSIGAFVLLLVMARIMGKKQISQLTFFDYCVGITIGSIAATMSVDQNIKIINGLAALFIWGIFPVVVAYFGLKSRVFSKITDGKATILIKNGEVLEKAMKKSQMSINELMLLLREKDIFKVSEVEMAVLETNGKLSVMKKSNVQPVTPKTLGITVEKEDGPTILIMDGQPLKESLSKLGYSNDWLLREIQKQGAADIKDVFLAQIDSNGEIYVDFYNEMKKQYVTEQKPMVASALKKAQADLESFSLQTDNPVAKQMYTQHASKLQETLDTILPYLK
ncbi:DUF421 domain-containing protein [Ornithinibacillus salinisoli]|uniref:DUF421 domain-containing protein n=1 Tax=Ornithinibacillus salinisoli TaxID=1848459 RepID=A0ABW4W1A5_9BACI